MSSIIVSIRNFLSVQAGDNDKQRLGFMFRFCLYSTLGIGLLYLVDAYSLVKPFCLLLAELTGISLEAVGLPVVIVGQKVILAGVFGIDIALECSGIPHLILFLSGVLAFKTSNTKRFYGLVLAVMVIFLGNLVRLNVIFLTGVYARDYFDFVHFYVFGGLSFICLVLLWVLWLRIFSGKR